MMMKAEHSAMNDMGTHTSARLRDQDTIKGWQHKRGD
jgi:hypothetical protein